jgi:hypothetical protein
MTDFLSGRSSYYGLAWFQLCYHIYLAPPPTLHLASYPSSILSIQPVLSSLRVHTPCNTNTFCPFDSLFPLFRIQISSEDFASNLESLQTRWLYIFLYLGPHDFTNSADNGPIIDSSARSKKDGSFESSPFGPELLPPRY